MVSIKDHERFLIPDDKKKADLDAFPKAIRERLVAAVQKQQRLWDEMRVEVIGSDDPYLRVTLYVDERLLYLFVYPDGKELYYQASVVLDFPEAASHFVLSTMSGRIPYPNFQVGEGEGLKVTTDEKGQDMEHLVDVLYGYGRVDFEEFVGSVTRLGLIIASMSVAEDRVRAFLDTPPIIKLVA